MRLMEKCVGGVDNVGETDVGGDDDDDGGDDDDDDGAELDVDFREDGVEDAIDDLKDIRDVDDVC